jgi:hypothetical protein
MSYARQMLDVSDGPSTTMSACSPPPWRRSMIAPRHASLSFILGTRVVEVPWVVAEWHRAHPGEPIPDGHVFTQRWPAGPAGDRRDQVIYYQYRHDRARRTLRGIAEQVAKAENAIAGKAPIKRNRFIQLSGDTHRVNRELEAKARALAGIKGCADVSVMPTSGGPVVVMLGSGAV